MWVSGSGKSTVMREVCMRTDMDIVYVPSYTSRVMRDSERQWDPYFFVSPDEFLRLEQEDFFVESMWVHGKAHYGTGYDALIAPLRDGRYPIKEIDIQGLLHIQQHKKLTDQYVSFFLHVSDEVMRQRMLHRQPDMPADELEARCLSAQHERLLASRHCDHVLDASQPLENVVNLLIQYIQRY